MEKNILKKAEMETLGPCKGVCRDIIRNIQGFIEIYGDYAGFPEIWIPSSHKRPIRNQHDCHTVEGLGQVPQSLVHQPFLEWI